MAHRRNTALSGEASAARYLQAQGYEILATNWRAGRLGEIDVVARQCDILVFVEVKTRTGTVYGLPEEAVDIRKRRQLLALAEAYLAQQPETSQAVRFNVIAVLPQPSSLPLIRHITGAFDADDG